MLFLCEEDREVELRREWDTFIDYWSKISTNKVVIDRR